MLEQGKSLVQREITQAVQDVAIEQLSNTKATPATLRQAVGARVQRLLKEPDLAKGLEQLIEGTLVDFGHRLIRQPDQPAKAIGDIEPNAPNLDTFSGDLRQAAERLLGVQEGHTVESAERQ